MNGDLLNGLNEHLKLEFRASHEYLAMAIWLAEHDLPGFSKWMRQQSSDELMHAQRIIDHLVERDQKVLLPAVGAPPTGWASAEALCDHVLKNEQEVAESINNMRDSREDQGSASHGDAAVVRHRTNGRGGGGRACSAAFVSPGTAGSAC